MLKLDEPLRNQEIFKISFLIVQIWDFLQFLVDTLPIGSGSVDPHNFADSHIFAGSQNIAEPTDPDPHPKHCLGNSNVVQETPELQGHLI